MSYSDAQEETEDGGSSRSLLARVPGGWYIGVMMAAGAALGFFVEGASAPTAWFMAVTALIAFVYPWFI